MKDAGVAARASRWLEAAGPAIQNVQRVQLIRLAKSRFGANWQAEFRYWLTCRGYYEMKNTQSEKPLYVGTTRVIPVADFEAVRAELSAVKEVMR